ncbi:ADP-ribose 1''-phosphate phosphatase [Trichomonascus vanleenenianus]|uniref:ADP-ribose 1''-phosphate phosphatase n=1 Tax=Trichomonascus vanleenenianus TaxID=2268995 RepID=UPI003ECB101F
MSIKYIKGNLFGCGPGSILAHSCNCHGVWGAGVAVAFKKEFPSTYDIYHKHCLKNPADKLRGTSLIIPSSKTDNGGPGSLIVCLFTSGGTGMGLDPPDKIVENTRLALADLRKQLQKNYPDRADDTINIPMINAGLFNVPWKDTEKALKDSGMNFTVYQL